jgi:integrase
MKGKKEHLVPLSRQAVETLAALATLTGRCPYAFPSAWSAHKPMSENAMGDLLHRAGLKGIQVAHGWRATFSTVMNERSPVDRGVIDLMLAHAPKDAVEAAYNRAAHLVRRRALAQEWADILLEAMSAATDLLNLPRRAREGKAARKGLPSRPALS